ncbi:MAG TPA: hypothetical protein VFX17_02050 [Patescibacteria group bacterium]|nr:hypothetical protein [Patescibacteria group bacterium]
MRNYISNLLLTLGICLILEALLTIFAVNFMPHSVKVYGYFSLALGFVVTSITNPGPNRRT